MNINKHKIKISQHNIILALVFFFIGFFASATFDSVKQTINNERDLDLFWSVWDVMERKYPFEEPSDEEKIYGAISGLVASYDDKYSSFFPPAKSEFFNQSISGEFGGIGVEITINSGYLSIVAPLKGSPGEKAGLLAGDIVTHVDAVDVTGMTLEEAIGLIRGDIGTQVILTVVRFDEEEPLDISIMRDSVIVPVINTEILLDTFVIHLYNFNESSEEPFKKALIEFKESGKDKLLIDLRNNPGGYLTSAIDMASYFIDQGEVVVIEKSGITEDDEYTFRSSGYSLLNDVNFETIVLINEGSASASEILAGALRDYGVAKIVGEQSYGKGSVQELVDLENNTSLKVTVSKWLTPSREQISEVGIKPEVYIDFISNNNTDIQLLESIKLFGVE
jgi:carboxyl-terminal processing protease